MYQRSFQNLLMLVKSIPDYKSRDKGNKTHNEKITVNELFKKYGESK